MFTVFQVDIVLFVLDLGLMPTLFPFNPHHDLNNVVWTSK